MICNATKMDIEQLGFSSLIELLEFRATQQKEKNVFIFLEDGESEENKLTYNDFDFNARKIAGKLQTTTKARERAIILLPPCLEYISAFFGCLYANVVAVPVYPPDITRFDQSMARLKAIVKDSGASAVLTSAEILEGAKTLLSDSFFSEQLKWIAIDTIEIEHAFNWKRPITDLSTNAFLQYTSGSTGAPKGVMVSNGNLLSNEKIIREMMEVDDKGSFVGWLPLYHDMGLIGNVLQSVHAGIRCVLMSPISFLQKPVRWLNAISKYKATLSGGPNFAYELCLKKISSEQMADIDLSSWSVAFNGAEPIRADTVNRFIERFEPCGFSPKAFYPCYGMAEATLLVTGARKESLPNVFTVKRSQIEENRVVEADASDDSIEYVSCGYCHSDQTVIIVDPQTKKECENDHIGEIWVSGPSVARGYWKNPEETKKTFENYLDTGEGPFLSTGDMGFLRNGELFITGRVKDMIIIHGKNHYPQDLEQVVEQSHPAVRPGCVAAFSSDSGDREQLIVVCEIKSRMMENLDLERVINSIQQNLLSKSDLAVHVVVLIEERTIPKTSSGKIQRNACRHAWMNNELSVIRQSVCSPLPSKPPESSTRKKNLTVRALIRHLPALEQYLQEQIAYALEISAEQVDLKKPIAALGLDSLNLVQLTGELQEDMGVTLDIKQILEDEKSLVDLAKDIQALSLKDIAVELDAGKKNAEDKTADNGATAAVKCIPSASNADTVGDLEIKVFRTIDAIPKNDWDALAPRASITLESHHLATLEKSGINDIDPYYLLISENHRTVGIAYFSIFDFDMLTLSDVPRDLHRTLRTWHSDFLNMKTLECGFISAIGESIAFLDDKILRSSLNIIAKKMEDIGKEAGADFILIRDIPYDRYHLYSLLEAQGYIYTQGFPTATLDIHWDSLEGYLASLKKKTRNTLKKYISKLHSKDITIEVIDDFGEHAERLASLYDQIHQKATDYQHEKLTASYFKEINKLMPTRSHVVAMKRHGDIIAFVLSLEGDQEYFGAYGGIDYQFNDQYNLYFNLYFLILKEAIKRGKKIANFGISAYDVKCKMGCELRPLGYFVKHIKVPRYTVALADLLNDSIKQPENPHRPFKDQDISNRTSLNDIKKEIVKRRNGNGLDVFKKADTYVRIKKLKLTDIYNFFPSFENVQDPVSKHNGKDVIMLGTNSYLGLTSNQEVIDFTKAAVDKYGTGVSGSPLLNGTLDIHRELTLLLAELMQQEDALIFSTGYQTNLGVISTILGEDSIAVTDKLNHASLIDGIMHSKAKIVAYRHNDMDSLEKVLIKYKDRPKLVITDSVFSMAGTMVNLPEVVRLKNKYNARLMIDEAHAFGTIGPCGRGVAELYGLCDQIDLIMGSFSKAFGSNGGFIAGNHDIIDYLRHTARSHIFSTSLPPAAIATVLAGLAILKKEPGRGRKAIDNARYMAEGLQKLGYKASFWNTAIVPVHCGNEVLAFALFKKLFERGVYANPVTHPAVPKKKSGLRTTYMATHTQEILDQALAVFADIRTPDFP